jgi:glycosyltransferase involved in cell wall biosynthesis
VRIAVNTLSVTDDNEGIRTMLIGLVPALVRLDRTNRYRLIVSAANERLLADVSGQVDMTVIDQKRRRPLLRILHDQTTVPWGLRHDTDLLLTLSSVGSLLAPVPQVVVLVAHLALPSVRKDAGGIRPSLVHRVYYGPVMRLSHRRAAAVVAISRFLADRLVADTGVPASKVHAIPCGIDLARIPPPTAAATQGSPYVLFVSTLYPYKNAEAVIRGLAHALPRLDLPLSAIIVGRDFDGTQIAALRNVADNLGIGSQVTLTGKVSDEERDRLYAGATAVVFPSLAEGFGFAPLEAMARGIPVVIANRTSLPEVVGDAALIVDPDRPEELGDAIVRLVGEPGLRADLVAGGRARAAELSWDRAALSFIELFSQLKPAGAAGAER